MKVNGAFKFHNVGQGLFYSGLLSSKIGSNHNVFSFVYDCGSTSSKKLLHHEIDNFKMSLNEKNKKLDLLVLSHLHDDHINGIDYLLQDLEVDTVVLPYQTEVFKLLTLLSTNEDNDVILDFYREPVIWLRNRGVRRVFLVSPEGENYNRGDLNESYFKTADSDQFQSIHIKNGGICLPYWEFAFCGINWYGDEEYRAILDKIIEEKLPVIGELSIENIKLLKKEIEAKFEEDSIKYSVNRTSVIMLHRPLNTSEYQCYSRFPGRCFNYSFNKHSLDTILTGDIELKENEDIPFLTNYMHDYHILQYPHHGSDKNNMRYFVHLDAIANVVSYGLTNSYMHPHINVREHVPNLILINERNAFDYQIFVN